MVMTKPKSSQIEHRGESVQKVIDDLTQQDGVLDANPSWEDVPKLKGANANKQAQALANRTEILNQRVGRVPDLSDFGGVGDYITDNSSSWAAMEAELGRNFEVSLAGGGFVRTTPTYEPSLLPYYFPPFAAAAIRHIQHGTESNPDPIVNQVTQVVKRVTNASRANIYNEQIGTAFFDLRIKGSGDVNAPALGAWNGTIINAYKDVRFEDGKLDHEGSVVGGSMFAGADYLNKDRLICASWVRAVTPKPTSAEFDAIAAGGGNWHTVGTEVNVRIRHKNQPNWGPGATIGISLYNASRMDYVSDVNDFTGRDILYGIGFGGNFMAGGNSANIENYSGFTIGINVKLIKKVGINFENSAAANAVGIKFENTRNNWSYKTAIDLGSNKLRIWDSPFSAATTDDGDIWYNGGNVYMKDSRYGTGVSRFLKADTLVSGESLVSSGIPTTPNIFLKVAWNANNTCYIPAIYVAN